MNTKFLPTHTKLCHLGTKCLPLSTKCLPLSTKFLPLSTKFIPLAPNATPNLYIQHQIYTMYYVHSPQLCTIYVLCTTCYLLCTIKGYKIGAMTMNLVQRRLFWWREHEIGGVSHFIVLKEWKFSEHGYELSVMG